MSETAGVYTTPTQHLSEYSLTAAFVIILWETIITIGDEVTYIWSKPRGAYIKWVYLFGKYFALVMQITVLWFQLGFLPYDSVSLQCCRIYRALEAAGIQLLMINFDLVLLLRIYALNGRTHLAIFLGAFAIVAETVMTVISMSSSIPAMLYDSSCTMINLPDGIFVFVVGGLTSQTTLLWLAYRKKEEVVRAERGRASAASVTIRDGIFAFIGMFMLFVVLLVCELMRNQVMNTIIYWFPVLLSLSTCRIIINLQQTTHEEFTAEFTTEIWEPEVSVDSLHTYEMQSRSRAR